MPKMCTLFCLVQIKNSSFFIFSLVFWFVSWTLAVISVFDFFGSEIIEKMQLEFFNHTCILIVGFNQLGTSRLVTIWTRWSVKPYKCFQSQSLVKKKKKKAYRCGKLNACLVVEIIQRWFFAFAHPLWPCIKVTVIKMSVSTYYAMHSLPSCQVWMS